MQEPALSQPGLMPGMDKQGDRGHQTGHRPWGGSENRQVLPGEEQGCCVKTRTRWTLAGPAHGGIEMAIVSLEKAHPSSPGLCPIRVLAQTL